jgi:hypothetical protein
MPVSRFSRLFLANFAAKAPDRLNSPPSSSRLHLIGAMKNKDQILDPDEQIERIRVLFAQLDQPAPRRGLGKFLHNLAERLSRPQKKVIMRRVREAEPLNKDAA